MGAVDRPAALCNSGRPTVAPLRGAARSIPRNRPWCGGSQRAGPPGPMFPQRPVDQGIEPPSPLVTLDLLIPQPLGIVREPFPDAGHLVRGEALDSGGDLLNCAHGCLSSY